MSFKPGPIYDPYALPEDAPVVVAVAVPEGADEAAVRRRLLDEYDIEIGGGLGAFRGKAWRIGLMGESATPGHVDALVEALSAILRR